MQGFLSFYSKVFLLMYIKEWGLESMIIDSLIIIKVYICFVT